MNPKNRIKMIKLMEKLKNNPDLNKSVTVQLSKKSSNLNDILIKELNNGHF